MTGKKRKGVTLSEIAKVAGVSLMTASRALNNQPGVSSEKRSEILRIAEDIRYVPNRVAQKLSGGTSKVIAVIAQIHSLYASDLVLGIGSAARTVDYEMLLYSLYDTQRRPPGAILDLLSQIADGVIVILPFPSELLQQFQDADLPIVTIDEGVELPFPRIVVDNYQGTRLAIQHLHDLGHRRIGFISGNPALASSRERSRAFADMQMLLGLDRDPELLVLGNFVQQGGYDAANELMDLKNVPTAIFAANDMSAVGALSAIRAKGLSVPDDMSVVGFDDVSIAHQVHPQLTTVRQPLAQMSRSAVNTLMAMIAGLEPSAQRIMLPAELVVRATTATNMRKH